MRGEKTDRHSTRSAAKQALNAARVFKVFQLDVPHDGRHAVCAERLYVRLYHVPLMTERT